MAPLQAERGGVPRTRKCGAGTAVTRDFRVKLLGDWDYLLWSVFLGKLLRGVGLLFLGYWLGKHL